MEKYHYPAAIFSFMRFEGGRYLRPFTGQTMRATYSLLIIESRFYSTHTLRKHTVCTFFDLLPIIEQMIIIYTMHNMFDIH